MIQEMTMRQVEAALPQLGYAPSFEKNLRAAVRTCAEVYGTDLDRIRADVTEFERRWGRGRVRHVPAPFRSAKSFRDWRKGVRIVLKRMSGAPTKVALDPRWNVLLTFVRTHQGKGRFLGSNTDLSLGVLARAASASGLGPREIDPAWIDRTAGALTNDRRKSFRRGLARLNALIALRERLPELGDLLPGGALPLPQPLRAAHSPWLRSAGDPAAALIWTEFDQIIARKRHGDDGAEIDGAPVQFSATSAKAYEGSLNWLLGGLAAQGLIEVGADLREIITHANLVAAVNHWIAERQGRGQRTDASTLHVHVSRLVHIAITYLDASPKEAERLVRLRKKPAIRTRSVGKMSESRETWIRHFDRDLAKQERAHRVPELLMQRAEAILSRERAGRAVPPQERMTALRLGVTAATVAILFRASPVRSTNLRTLRMRGEGAELDLRGLRRDDRFRQVRLIIPATQVKNGNAIDEIADDDLAPVVEWYLREIRSRLILTHPFGKNHVDSDYLFPSTGEGAMERSVFSDAFRRACAEIGFDMTMHQARHVCVYWILSVDPNAWGEAAALLGDSELTVRKYYAWLSERRASDAARAKLRGKRAATRSHRQGVYDDEE